MSAKQGHRYRYDDKDVLALESGADVVSVVRIDESRPWPLSEPFDAIAANLTPLPMRYFGGEVPA